MRWLYERTSMMIHPSGNARKYQVLCASSVKKRTRFRLRTERRSIPAGLAFFQTNFYPSTGRPLNRSCHAVDPNGQKIRMLLFIVCVRILLINKSSRPMNVRAGTSQTSDDPANLREAAVATAVAVVIISTLYLTTPVMTAFDDGLHYLDLAEKGLWNNDALTAPYAYRFGAPMIVRFLHGAFGLPVWSGFMCLSIASAYCLLIASYRLARASGSSHPGGLIVLTAIGFSFFHVRFPLAAPTMVDVEGFALLVVAILLLLRKKTVMCLVVSCLGLLFKEFLIIPPVLLIVQQAMEYRRTKAILPLRWILATLLAVIFFFVAPRVILPIRVGYGANFRWDFGSSQRMGYFKNLRAFLPAVPDAGRIVNIVLAFLSYWLPVILLSTPGRLVRVWRESTLFRPAIIVCTTATAALALIGGTNIMIFAAYSVPAMILVLARLRETGTKYIETAAMLIAVCLFNRIPWTLGNGGMKEIAGFYGAWWSLVDGVTLERFLEILGWVLLLALVRFLVQRAAPKDSGGVATQ